MTTTLAVPTEPNFQVVNKHTDFETWKQDGEALFSKYEATESASELIQWRIGDWLVKGEKEFREKAYEEAERITAWKRSTLYNVVWVTTNIPPESSLRSEIGVKWSHFKELARIKDDKDKEKLLEEVRFHFEGSGRKPSVEDIRWRVDLAVKPRHSKPEKPSKHFVLLQVPVRPRLRDLIKRYAHSKNKTPDALLRGIVEEYFADEKKIEAEIEQARKSRQGKSR